jgi:uncharacterized phage protein (TIGR02220 family)
MPIIHVTKRENPYAQIDKRCLEDDRLSWRSKGILAYLLSKPNDWQVSVADLQARGREGREAVQAALKELQAAGYASLQIERGEKGALGGKRWTITEEPTNGFSVHRQRPTDKRVSRRTVSPTVGNSDTSNNDINSNNKKEKEKVLSGSHPTTPAGENPEPLEAEKKAPPIPAAPPNSREPIPEPKYKGDPIPKLEAKRRTLLAQYNQMAPGKEKQKILGIGIDVKSEIEINEWTNAAIERLNEKTGFNYRLHTKESRKVLARRFTTDTIDDVFTVIDAKAKQWKGDPKMREYLRPETLFNGHFEAYLQSAIADKTNPLPSNTTTTAAPVYTRPAKVFGA